MQQPQKKRDPRTMAPRAYDLFKRAEKTNRRLTLDLICQYSGYSLKTARGYLNKKWRHHFLHADGTGGYFVNGISQISKAEFVGWHQQTLKKLPQKIVVEKEVDRYFRLVTHTIECDLVIVVLVLAGICWRR